MSGVNVDWSSAEVRDGKLEVALRGEMPGGWKDSFERTVALLPVGEWGKVRLKKDRIRVSDVVEGSEDRLHHFLESVVFQANADNDEGEREEREEQDVDEEDEDETRGPDAEMSQRFRSFAAEPDEGETQPES